MAGLLIGLLVSQNLFAKTFGGVNYESVRSMAQTGDGGYVLGGGTMSFGVGATDLLVLKLASDGSLQWSKTFGGTDYDDAYSVAQTGDGGYVVAGETRSFGAGICDVLVLKLASDGSLQWAKTFGGTDYDWPYSVAQTGDGGYVVAGYTESFGAGVYDFLVLKLASDGSLQWTKTFGGTDYDDASSVAQTGDGGYVVAGKTRSFGAGAYDVLVLKLASDGSLQWAKTFGGTEYEIVSSMVQTADGGYIVAGYTDSFGAGAYDVLVLKLTSDGSLQWARTFGGTDNDYAYSVLQTSDGGYVVAGYTDSFSAGYDDVLVLKLASDGSLQWAKTFGGTSYEIVRSGVQTADGGCAVAGYTESFGAGGPDVLVLKLTQDGNYSGCVETCTPTVGIPSLDISSPSLGLDCMPSTSSLSLSVGSPTLVVGDVCTPVNVNEPGDHILPCVASFPGSGSVIFKAADDVDIKIYSPDGRLAYSGQLRKGSNTIWLGRGVYIWQAGGYNGKAVVR